MRKTLLNTLAITAIALAGSSGAAKAGQPTPTPTPTPKQKWVVIEMFGNTSGNTRKTTPKPNAKAIVRSKSNITNNKQAATPTPTPKTKAMNLPTASSFDAGGNPMRSNISKPTPTPTPKQQH